MSTATLLPPTNETAPASGTGAAAARFLAGWVATVLPLLAAAVTVELAWALLDADAWPAAVAVTTGWALAAAGWLRSRGWPLRAVRAVMGGPATVLAAAAAVGWLSLAGLVLWGPVSTVLAVALAMTAQPLALGRKV